MRFFNNNIDHIRRKFGITGLIITDHIRRKFGIIDCCFSFEYLFKTHPIFCCFFFEYSLQRDFQHYNFCRFFFEYLLIHGYSAQQPADRNSQKNNEKLGATPNQRIKKRESGFVVVQTPFILSLTPKPPHPSPPNFGQNLEKRDGFTSVFLTKKCVKYDKQPDFLL